MTDTGRAAALEEALFEIQQLARVANGREWLDARAIVDRVATDALDREKGARPRGSRRRVRNRWGRASGLPWDAG